MKAAAIHGGFDVRVEEVSDPALMAPTDAVVRVLLSCICGSDLWPYRTEGPRRDGPARIGHELLGVVEEVGTEVATLRPGDVVIAPFVWSDGTCVHCRGGVRTSCLHGGGWGADQVDGGQGEAVRVPQADGTLVVAHVLECVGMQASWDTAIAVARPGGTVAYVGVPAGVTDGLPLRTMFSRNISVHGGVAPVRAYLPELLGDVLSEAIDPSPVFDQELPLSAIAEGYVAMHERRAIKTLLRP